MTWVRVHGKRSMTASPSPITVGRAAKASVPRPTPTFAIRFFAPASGTAADFASGINQPVDLQVGPDGALYYLTRGNSGQVFRVNAVASQPLNISVRSRVGTGNDVMISGFINSGTAAKKVILRALGP